MLSRKTTEKHPVFGFLHFSDNLYCCSTRPVKKYKVFWSFRISTRFLLFEFKYTGYYPNNEVLRKTKKPSAEVPGRGNNWNSLFSSHQQLTRFAKFFQPQAAVALLTTSTLICSSGFLPQTHTKSQPKAQETTSLSHAASTVLLPECPTAQGTDGQAVPKSAWMPTFYPHELKSLCESGKHLPWEMCWQRLRANSLCSKKLVIESGFPWLLRQIL